MNQYVDEKFIEGFTMQTTQGFAEAVEFAIDQRRNMGESSPDEERQAAQEALLELTNGLVDAGAEAYRKAGLTDIDYRAIATVFEKLAVKAKIRDRHTSGGPVTLVTRKGSYHGVIVGLTDEEGEEMVVVSEGKTINRVPVVAVLEVSA